MKTYFNLKNPKTLSILLTAFVLLSIGFTGCKKGSTPEDPGFAYIRAANSAQASAPQDFYVDESKVNTTPLAYTQVTAYATAYATTHAAIFKTSSTGNVNVAGSIYLVPGTYNTIYYADDNTGVTTQDDRTAPQAGKARVRFMNLSTALNSSVDFGISTGSKIVTGLAYKIGSAYNEVDAATSFTLYAAGSSTVELNIPTTIEAGKIYTIIISGTTKATLTYTVYAEN
ncbi:hypothetical protein GCM10027049_16990 [Mucilaginibacter puniceus]